MSEMLDGKCIVLGVTGGIAAYKACEIASSLGKKNASVRVVMTESACQLVSPKTFEALTGNPVYTGVFESADRIVHIDLANRADLILVAPATANIMAKAACGIADDLLSTVLLAAACPVAMAPAMNARMWRAPATQQNAETLRARGVRFIGPEQGHLACGVSDIGRMTEPAAIVEAVQRMLSGNGDMNGLRVLVTAGPTREKIDPVRFLTNRSSGKMGYALAQAAAGRGASVTLVSGPVALERPANVELVPIESTQDLYREVTRRAPEQDIIIQAAAPADFTPEAVSDSKIKKTGDGLTLRLKSTPDVAKALGETKPDRQVLVAFAAETDDLLDNARGKLLRKNADLVAANDVTQPDAGFGVDTNRIVLIGRDGETALPLLTKAEAAQRILDAALRIYRAK